MVIILCVMCCFHFWPLLKSTCFKWVEVGKNTLPKGKDPTLHFQVLLLLVSGRVYPSDLFSILQSSVGSDITWTNCQKAQWNPPKVGIVWSNWPPDLPLKRTAKVLPWKWMVGIPHCFHPTDLYMFEGQPPWKHTILFRSKKHKGPHLGCRNLYLPRGFKGSCWEWVYLLPPWKVAVRTGTEKKVVGWLMTLDVWP